ncbi:uncharacterized protein BO80DRAFT_347360 [Aspergillus ibericus CBS 121593]|uniref:Uncharacterized protein n=1 Tax=Aspergillus ibericus CBS 121593 TaxID=1448316 RepID=A0A395HC41_9EURO|nr:hypothetical protein BO80DRAFT_347360 [Aspergillus ibericus CBS 121593]RAL04715.1 hypothetical protein BO80DRAFT_347360 [Aspergillus ibericus CBS 121593]
MSSHKTHLTNPLQRKVDELVQKYDRITEPSPVLREILRDSEGLASLVHAIRRQVSLVRCRSQDPEDAQITIYDHALLVLSNYGDDPRDTGALELYLTEFLGIVPISTVFQARKSIDGHVTLRNVVTKVTGSGYTPGKPTVIDNDAQDKSEHRVKVNDNKERHQNDESIGHSHPSSSPEDTRIREQAHRLIQVYRAAKTEYSDEKQRDGVHDLSLVRYLRDTAENTLLYLQGNGMSDHPLIQEIEYSFKMARDKAAQLSGGRGRRFDEPREPRYPPKLKRKRGVDSYRPRD